MASHSLGMANLFIIALFMKHRDRDCREFLNTVYCTRRSNREERVKTWLVDLEIAEIIIIDGNNVGRCSVWLVW